MTKKYESRRIRTRNGQIAYFKFSQESNKDCFSGGLMELRDWIKNVKIKFLIINMEAINAWNEEDQQVWIETGALIDQAGITKWGVVSTDLTKHLTIKNLIKGAGSPRAYDILVSTEEDVCLGWIKD